MKISTLSQFPKREVQANYMIEVIFMDEDPFERTWNFSKSQNEQPLKSDELWEILNK